MRIMMAAAVLAATASLALADDQNATTSTAALQTTAPQSLAAETSAETATTAPLFYGFSGGCQHDTEKQDTAKLLMN